MRDTDMDNYADPAWSAGRGWPGAGNRI